MSQESKNNGCHNRINFGTDLADDLWITVCNYLEPYERFKLCLCCHDLNDLLCITQYPFYSFYKSDINYWVNNIEWMTSNIKTKRSENKKLAKYAFNFYHFDSIYLNNPTILLSIKYYIIFYERISGIGVNKKIEKMQHLLKLRYENENMMARLSDDEYEKQKEEQLLFEDTNENEKQNEHIINEQLKALQIDITTETHYLPSTIIHIYMHEISNTNQCMIKWICDILSTCHSNCAMFRDTHFDKSNLNNQSINYLCNALMKRHTQFNRLRNLFFSGNTQINDQCIEKLLCVLYDKCPGLVYLNLDRTGITNKSCHIIHSFYTKYLIATDAHIKRKIPKFEYIDLSNNDCIDIHGIDIINDIFIKYHQFNINNNLVHHNAIQLSVDFDVSNCNWSVARFGWTDHIIYDD